jgi:STE24 endopeptidase
MMRRKKQRALSRAFLLWAALALAMPAFGFATPQAPPSASESAVAAPTDAAEPSLEDYALSPQVREKAVEYSHIRYVLYFAGVVLSLGIYLLLWTERVGVDLRSVAGKISTRRFVQTLIFVPLFLALVSVLKFPLVYYSDFAIERRFGLSTQTFLGWLADWGKSFAITALFLTLVIWGLYVLIRRSPRRWWFYFWLFTIPVTLAVILLQPLVIDPLFFKFTPLEKTRPELTTRIEEMLGRAGLDIPRSRIYEMNASSKTTAVNAYVTGIGASKRLVIWDNTLKKLTPDETLLVVGHETGHYALHHIPKIFALVELVSFVFIFVGFVMVEKLVARWGGRTRLGGVGDLASLPVLFLALTVITFLANPAICAISRHYEHQADQYGLEVAHGIVPDVNAADARSFQILGEENLADPDPSAFIRFWLYTHPPLEERIRFALSYKPWAEGKPLQLVHPRE